MPYKDPKDPRAIEKRKERYRKYKLLHPERFKDYNSNWKKNNPERHKELNAKYRDNNRQKLREISKKYYQKNLLKLRDKRRAQIEQLDDIYVRGQLLKIGFKINELYLHPEIVETQKIILKIKRHEKHHRTKKKPCIQL